MNRKWRSGNLTGTHGDKEWPQRAAARAMLRAVDFKDEDDFDKPLVAIGAPYTNATPCNNHIEKLGHALKEATAAADAMPLIFGTPVVSDGIAMGTGGMKYSLMSRDLIADCIETMIDAYFCDGAITIGGCDKSIPGAVMPLARTNVPSIFIYGGSILPDKYKGKDLNIVSSFEAIGAHSAGKIDDEQLKQIECHSCPGSGSCGGMYTANTMASAYEALGISLPGSADTPAVDENNQLSAAKADEARRAAQALNHLLEQGIKPRDIMTKPAFENAITVILALGGSTNAVLHLLATAREADVDLTLEDFSRLSKKTPLIGDLKPAGKYMMLDVNRVGGVQMAMKELLKAGLINGDCLTVTGKTVAENLESAPDLPENQDVIYPVTNPVAPAGQHLRFLSGNLAENGSVMKLSGKEPSEFRGPAKVFESEEACTQAILAGEVEKGQVLVIRNEGPRGGPGMREMLSPTSAIIGAGLGTDVALITDGRFSGGSHGRVVGHIDPEAATGGLIGLVQDGDPIIVDSKNDLLQLDLPEDEITTRKTNFEPKPNPAPRGVLAKYQNTVGPASQGATTC